MQPLAPPAASHASEIQEVIHSGPFPIRFPPKGLPQDQEWCEVQVEGQWKKIRFHDYADVYRVPGLYETIFYRTLRCNSPNRITTFLSEVVTELGADINEIRALDLGAGNGMSGEALQTLGVRKIVGVDLLPMAKEAALRDRPWVYDHYLVADFTQLTEEQSAFLKEYRFNTLCTIAALGFGDIPPLAFHTAFNLVADGGLIAFNIREEFLKRKTGSPFATLVNHMIEEEVLELELLKRYQHRLDTQGKPIYYIGLVARKNRDIPAKGWKQP